MKNKFKGYYKPTEAKIKTIWDRGFISIDANVLLNLYRYSDDTRNELLLKVREICRPTLAYCISPLNGWTKFEIKFSHLNLGLCQRKEDNFL